MQGRAAHPARGLALSKGPVHRVEQAQRFDRAVAQIARIALERHHAADVDVPQVHRRVAIDDPFREHLPAPPADWMPIELKPAATKKIAKLRRFAEEVAVIRREAFRPVEE